MSARRSTACRCRRARCCANKTFATDGGGFSPADLKLAENAALAACDISDGLKDGLIADPRACGWDPGALQCSGAKTATCLSVPQVTALRTIYSGIKSSDGSWAMMSMSRGGESGWTFFVGTDGKGTDPSGGGGLAGLWQNIMGRPIDVAMFDPGQGRTGPAQERVRQDVRGNQPQSIRLLRPRRQAAHVAWRERCGPEPRRQRRLWPRR